MIKNYLRTALRNLIRFKGFSLINIIGLSLSMSVCMLIIVVILDQYSYDKMHTKRDRIYRVQQVDSLANIGLRTASNPYPLGVTLRDDYAIAEEVAILNNNFQGEGIYKETRLEINGMFASTNFFDVFDFRLEKGSREGILDEPFSLVLTHKTARKFFGTEDPVGKFIQIDTVSYEVKGVVEETKQKSQIQFEALISLPTLEIKDKRRQEPRFVGNWETGWGSWIYLLLDPQADLTQIQEILDQISLEHYRGNKECNYSFYLQPMDKVVPGPLLGNEIGMFLPRVFVIFLAGLALVIIVSAAFNYTSLSVARSMLRAKEVGVRKTFGAFRSQVIMQFLTEAVVIALFSFLIAIALLQFLLPAFSGMQMMSMLEVRPDQNIKVYGWFLAFALATGLLSGALPALLISAFRPVAVLKGVMEVKFFSRLTLRKILLVTQFVFSMVFIISILLIFKQMKYMLQTELGFDSTMVYDVDLQGKSYEQVRQEFSQLPEVVQMSACSHVPAVGNTRGTDLRLQPEDDKTEVHYFSVDEHFIETMGLELMAGRNFPGGMSKEHEQYVIASEMLVDQYQLGTPADALGTILILRDSTLVEIIGIIKDFQYTAVFLPPKPVLLRYIPTAQNHAFLRVESPDISATLDKLRQSWRQIDPDHELDGDFLDGRIRYYYTFFEDIMYTVGVATLLAIIIAVFGLLGMATFSTQTRLKEIGVRKVLGANTRSIVLLLSRAYLWLMAIAAVIGGVIAYLANNLWLKYLAKSVEFGLGTILTGVFIVVVSGLVAITSQTLKAAGTRPAKILKDE